MYPNVRLGRKGKGHGRWHWHLKARIDKFTQICDILTISCVYTMATRVRRNSNITVTNANSFVTLYLNELANMKMTAASKCYSIFALMSLNVLECSSGLGPSKYSNRTICSPWSPFCTGNFPFVSLLYCKANSYCPRGLRVRKGNLPNFRNGLDRGFWLHGQSNLTSYNPLSPFQCGNFPFVPLLYWEADSYYPQRLIVRKGESSQSQEWMVLTAWDIQTRPVAAL